MKVLNLFCSADHAFEGWFGSEQDFQDQLQRGLVQCPMCGTTDIRKGLTAPRLSLGAAQPLAPDVSSSRPPANARELAQLQRQWLQASRQIMQQTEDVGERFAAEARRMHYGEIEERAIRGQASSEQALQLLDEGIPVMPLLLPDAAKDTLQ